MSERNDQKGPGAGNENGATRQMPALETSQDRAASGAAASPRRRRADKYHQEESHAPQYGAAKQPAASGMGAGALHGIGEGESGGVRYTAHPMIESETETAREVASRMRMQDADASSERATNRAGEADRLSGLKGSRVPPQAARMHEAARNRMEASRQRGTERESVGYAPGRMGQKRPPYGGRDRAMSEWAPPAAMPPRQGDRQMEPGRKSHRGLAVALIVVLVLGLLALGVYLIPEDAGGLPGRVKATVTGWISGITGTRKAPGDEVISFTVSDNGDMIAPMDVSFTVKTTGNVQGVRLADKEGQLETTEQITADDAGQTTRTLVWHVAKAFTGDIYLQIRLQEDKWLPTEHKVSVTVNSPDSDAAENAEPERPDDASKQDAVVFATNTPEPTDTPEPTAVPDPAAEEGEAPEKENVGEDQPGSALEALSEGEPTAEPTSGNRTRREKTTAAPAAEDQEASGSDGAEETFAPAGPEETLIPETEEGAPEAEETAEQVSGDAGEDAEKSDEPAEPAAEEPADVTEDAEGSQDATRSGEQATAAVEELPGEAEEIRLTAKACEAADPSLITSSVIYNGTKKASEYSRPEKELITMPVGGEYTRKAEMGILTFRLDAFRQNAAYGRVSGAEALETVWKAEAGSVKGSNQTYYGIGWVGQPAIVKWSKQVREKSEMYTSKQEVSALKEVIVGGLDGNIYFLDLADGGITRNSIKLGFPMKGSASVHPSGAPYFNIGQYARKMAKGTGKIGLRQYNLYTQKEMTLIDGLDGTNRRYSYDVGSFETSALIDRNSNTLVTAGTNGLLYVINMGDTFDYQLGVYTQSPSTVLLKTRARGEKEADTAVEASVAMYDRYVFYADMGGILRCVDTNTMKVVWAVDTEDSVESTPALCFNSEGGLNLYTANILNKRKSGDATVRCYDAMSGEEKWATAFGVTKDTKNKTTSGFRASPVIGQNGLSGMVFYTVNNLSEEGADALGMPGAGAALIAMDAATGQVRWSRSLSGRAYSSPVAVYDEAGNGWIIQCAGDGSILLLNGLEGTVVNTLTVEGAIEGSPAVYKDMMVVGTTQKGANHIYGIRIK